MNSKILLCLALVFGTGLFIGSNACRADGTDAGSVSATHHEQDLESLWDETFPGKKLEDIHQWARYWETDFWTPFWVSNFQRLPRARCNEIAIAAARGLSLQIENGDRITAAVIEKPGHQFPSKDSPEQAAFRRLDISNTLRIQLLSGMAQLRLISDSRVIEPLVNMLGYPSNSFLNFIFYKEGSGGQGVAPILCKLTGCEYYNLDRYETGQKHAQFVKGWRDWLERNKDKRLIFDPDMEQMVKDRIATIELRLCRDTRLFGLLGSVTPESIRITHLSPGRLVDLGVDTSLMQNFIPGSTANFYLRITAKIGNPPVSPRPVQIRRHWQPLKERLLREVLPHTDIVIIVEAASKDNQFIQRLRDHLAQLPPPPDSVAVADRQWEAVRTATVARLTDQLQRPTLAYEAANTLIRLQSETPVINALTNVNQSIRRAALYALANPSVTAVAVAPLVSLLKSNTPDCLLAMTALAHIRKGKAVAIPALLPLLHAKNSSIRQHALQTLCAYKAPAKTLLPTFMDLLSDTNPVVRQAVIGVGANWVLENEESGIVVPALISKLNDSNRDVRLSAAICLGQIMNKKLYGGAHPYPWEHLRARPLGNFAAQAKMILPAIIGSLSDPNAEVRAATAAALGNTGPFEKAEDAKIVAALVPALRDENKKVSAAAASAVENFGAAAADAVPVLTGLTNELGWTALSALSQIQAALYRPKLEKIVQEKYPRLDWAAAPVWRTETTHWTVETNVVPRHPGNAASHHEGHFQDEGNGSCSPHPVGERSLCGLSGAAQQKNLDWVGDGFLPRNRFHHHRGHVGAWRDRLLVSRLG